jgi:hypothetical protein
MVVGSIEREIKCTVKCKSAASKGKLCVCVLFIRLLMTVRVKEANNLIWAAIEREERAESEHRKI